MQSGFFSITVYVDEQTVVTEWDSTLERRERETQRGLLLSPVMIDVEVHYSVLDMTSVIELHHSHLRQHGLPKRDKWVPCSLTKKLSLSFSLTHTHSLVLSLSLDGLHWSSSTQMIVVCCFGSMSVFLNYICKSVLSYSLSLSNSSQIIQVGHTFQGISEQWDF